MASITGSVAIPSGRLFKAETLVERTVLLVGPSGSGKSQIINALRSYNDRQDVAAALSAQSVTKETISLLTPIQIKNNGVNYTLKVYDTRGLTDSVDGFVKSLDTWVKMIKEEITAVHYVVYVLPLDRLSSTLLEEIIVMTRRFIDWGMSKEHVILLLNKCDFWNPVEIQKYSNSLQTSSLPEILKTVQPILSCFINPAFLDQSEEYRPIREIANKKMETSTNHLLSLLCRNVAVPAFKPRQVILNKEEQEALAKLQLAEAERKKCVIL